VSGSGDALAGHRAALEHNARLTAALRRIRAIASDALALSGDSDSLAECDAADFRAILAEVSRALGDGRAAPLPDGSRGP